MPIRLRKLVGTLILLIYLTLYIAGAVMVGEMIPRATVWEILYFMVAGIVWIIPLRPLFRWMNGFYERGAPQG